ncbi:hypothetical protein SMIM3I_02226 [Streptococcus mitis]|uniref:Integrase catalytic domain-containing protein n=1 Tax=Streptococcus mitis TaxID=28037 RepID=A0A150NXH4_STRMT|nr:hypothetical protein SMIM3I_02226 [Streptococcus mitis]
MSVRARRGTLYFITFINDFTCYSHVYLISHKLEILNYFKSYINLVKNQLDKKIKTFKTNRGREYLLEQFKYLCDEKGISRQLTIPRTPQQNSVAKMRNRMLLDMVRSMITQENIPISHWKDALLIVTYVLNQVPSKTIASTPYELWNNRKPDLSILRLWGSATYIHNLSHK